MGDIFLLPNSQRMNLYGPLIFGKDSRGLLGFDRQEEVNWARDTTYTKKNGSQRRHMCTK